MVIFIVSVLGLALGALAGRAGAHLYAPHSTAELLLVAIPCCLGEMFVIGKLMFVHKGLKPAVSGRDSLAADDEDMTYLGRSVCVS